MASPGFTVTLVRHGQTTMNMDKLIQTRTDALLSNLGETQSNLLGEYLSAEKFNHVYSSDMTRALQTAQCILNKNKNKPIPQFKLDSRLRERDFGNWEGKSVFLLHEAARVAGIRMHRFDDADTVEKYEDHKKKSLTFFKELCETRLQGKDSNSNLLIVSHGGWVLTFFDMLQENPEIFHVKNLVTDENVRSPLNTSFSQFRIEKDTDNQEGFVVTFSAVCDDTHLKSLNM